MQHRIMIPRFLLASIGAYGVCYIAAIAGAWWGGMPDYIVYLVSIISIALYNFVVFKNWVYVVTEGSAVAPIGQSDADC